MTYDIVEATAADAGAIAEIHLVSRRVAMAYLIEPHSDEGMRDWFERVVAKRPRAWWVARDAQQILGYMLIQGEDLEHLYVSPGWQGRGIGRSLLSKAKELSPHRIVLKTFVRNTRAQALYESEGFRVIGSTDGQNDEGEPDLECEWKP